MAATASFDRRRLLQLVGGAGLLALVGCASESAPQTQAGATTSSPNTPGSAGVPPQTVPEETAGPFPGDGSNGPNVLTQNGVVRSDIRSSFGSLSGTAQGVPMTIKLGVFQGGKPLAAAAVYVWHCDRDGNYSLYSQAATDQNYLRGVQPTDGQGVATFTSIYPACYSGRWPHIHFEVYPSVTAATAAGAKLATSQIALLEDTSKAVYATSGYEQSVTNLSRVSLATDMVFSDGATLETPTVSGSVADGYVVSLNVAV
jgi:protocatechuate 3,4-dioxygenase beta subunit